MQSHIVLMTNKEAIKLMLYLVTIKIPIELIYD